MGESGLYVDFRKWPDTSHWHFTVLPLGLDEHGLWFYLPAGAAVQRGSEPVRTYPQTSAMLLREGAWWTAFWNTDRKEPHELYVDVATPAVFEEGRVTLVDLDLDVVRSWDGEVEVIDRDEFELHRELLGYPLHLVEGAERSARELTHRIQAGAEPFASVGHRWLERAVAKQRP